MAFISEFKKFAITGNVVDMAVGVIMGGAFGTVVKSLVDQIIMPPIGLLLGNVDFSELYLTLHAGKTPGPYATLAAAKEAGATVIGYGAFINTFVSFLLVAFAVFLMVRGVNRLRAAQAAADAAKAAAAPPPAPPAPPRSELLLEEIRDLLKRS